MLNERLREIRKKEGKTQKEVADNINMARSTYTFYETGKREPDFQTLIKLADYYVISLDYFADREAATFAENKLSLNEITLIKKYRALDEDAKNIVIRNINGEYEDAQGKLDKSSKKTFA